MSTDSLQTVSVRKCLPVTTKTKIVTVVISAVDYALPWTMPYHGHTNPFSSAGSVAQEFPELAGGRGTATLHDPDFLRILLHFLGTD